MNLKAEINSRLEKIASHFAADESTEEATEATTEETAETVAQFAEVTLMDGETILSYDGELAEGTAVFVVLEGEQAPAPEGTHELGGDMAGVSIVLDADGIILEIVDAREEAEEAEPQTDEMMSSENVAEIVDEKMSEINEPLNAILSNVESLIDENKSLKAEIETLRTEFNAFKNEPSKNEENLKFNRSEKPQTRREKYLNNLRK
tara:strand:+ start:340 stop:957 length:618 start_codon:yes stop_codon:yes gene_type:complete